MSNITRLPTQHRLHPICIQCKADMPAFDDCHINVGPTGNAFLFAVTFHVQCEKCGAKQDFRKTVKT